MCNNNNNIIFFFLDVKNNVFTTRITCLRANGKFKLTNKNNVVNIQNVLKRACISDQKSIEKKFDFDLQEQNKTNTHLLLSNVTVQTTISFHYR